jgi:hypothetical protein
MNEIKILHIRCATPEIEKKIQEEKYFKYLFSLLEQNGWFVILSCVTKHGLFQRVNEVEFEVFRLEGNENAN